MPESMPQDACELLDADHIAVKHLFVEYARQAMAAPEEARDRQALAQRICQELTVHAQIEEEIFYPALREAIAAPQLLDEAQAEHQQAKALIARIRGMRAPDPRMDDLVSQLANAVEHHVKEERDVLFPKARVAPGLDLMALGAQLKERQDELVGQAA
ncbi:hemerythrin domain-containing protein [Ramlibacter ginsenosidimutans]|uniref:Hemerythrin domain-containing protein n=1 Tax=Ramlibacter ginsenosidimutans TaxID=502333 RepID=A0A934TV10_9BURK|nr:hemerythrin domain-containing protein [Ramlibacter ginsenosidimutans]MBK6007815.1 hemerythrin domain-containing protein [Ramlibacter ginsenosidimutans]